ncbi:MAG: hypothetical protein ABI599_02185 [Flavobacteriales bacterium]
MKSNPDKSTKTRVPSTFLRKAAAASAFIVVCSLVYSGCKKGELPTGGRVNGSVHTVGRSSTGDDVNVLSRMIFLPDIEVYLVNMGTNAESAPVTTDLFGRYYFPVQPPGTYQLRWKAQHGWAEGVLKQEIVIRSATKHPNTAAVVPDKKGLMVFGSVKLADGGSPYFSAVYFDKPKTALVTVMDMMRAGEIAQPARVNAYGDYAIAGVPRGTEASIRAKSEAAIVTRALAAAAIAGGGGTDLELPEHRPQITTVVKSGGGALLRTAPAGSTIQLTAMANDADGDPLQFEFKCSSGNGTFSGSGATIDWKLPAEAGHYYGYVLAKDGRGGYATQRIDFDVDKKEDDFAGRAIDKSTGMPVGNAMVTVGGKNTTTDANGYFAVKAPMSDRYVLNITKPGYALCSRVVYAGLTGQTWKMVKAQEQSVDPAQDIVLVDGRKELEKQKRKGATVKVPANSLVDKNGDKPTGMLTGYIATLNIGDSESPGDWGAKKAGGDETNLISYGATWVEFLDAAGNKYNLQPGAEAVVQQPSPDPMLPAAPPSAKLWSYDESDGYWKISGSAQRVTGGYAGKVSHFSTVNTDVEKDDPACLKILVYPGIALGSRLRITDPTGATFSQSFDLVLDAGLNAVYRLPPNTNVKLELFNPDGSAATNVIFEEKIGEPLQPIADVVNTGPPIPAGDDWRVPLPYETCHLVVVLPDFRVETDKFLVFKGAGNAAQADAYHLAVDPQGLRDNLGEWWDVNGFTFPGGDKTQPPNNAIRTSYLNFNDLGSGRDMYFLKRADGTVAAYVTNYGLFNQDEHNAVLATNRDTPGATVCMEYSPVEGEASGTRIVKFFVFAGNGFGANAPHVGNADLDGFGDKFVPNLCNNCHGGDYSAGASPSFADINMGASFRELDYATYKFVPGSGPDEAAFKQQNQIVHGDPGDNISSASIQELIDGWYRGGTVSEDNTFTPAGWLGTAGEPLYHSVVAKSCRTCHVALREDINWSTYEQLKGAYPPTLKSYALCDGRIMPHAAVTYRNYWLSALPHSPEELRTFSDGTWTPLGDCELP